MDIQKRINHGENIQQGTLGREKTIGGTQKRRQNGKTNSHSTKEVEQMGGPGNN